MSVLASLSLTSRLTIALCVLCAFLAVCGLVRTRFSRAVRRSFPSRRRRSFATPLTFFLTAVLFFSSTLAVSFNRSMRLVPTVGDLLGIVGASTGQEAAASPESGDTKAGDAISGEHGTPQSASAPTFTTTDLGALRTQWRGNESGIEGEVQVITPRDYSPSSTLTYGVIELLHGYPGGPDGLVSGLNLRNALQDAIDRGIIPPSIIVIPSLNVDDAAHDCADLSGRPAVFTWVSHDIPDMVRAAFPNTSRDRNGWLLTGFSAGAYCAVWTALNDPARYGAAASFSGYDRQIEGAMTAQAEEYLHENTLSVMLGARVPDGLRIYAMAAQDDAVGGASAAQAMSSQVRAPDTVTVDTPMTGGHTGVLWSDKFPTLLAWWGSSDSVARALGAADTSGIARSSNAYESISSEAGTTRTSAPLFAVNGVGTLTVFTVASFAGCAVLTIRRRGAFRDRSGTSSRFLSVPASKWGSRARIMWSGVCCTTVCLLCATTVLLIANACGGFYTSWHTVARSLLAALLH